PKSAVRSFSPGQCQMCEPCVTLAAGGIAPVCSSPIQLFAMIVRSNRTMLQPILRVVLILLAVLAPVPAAAQEWWEAETDNFVVKSQGNREEVRAFALDLERFDATLRIFQGLPVGNRYPGRSQKLTVYRLGDNSGTGFLAGSEEPGAFYIARAGNSAAFLPRDDSAEADTAFRHEYAHYFMSQNFPASYPIWYVEGFAQVMATARSNFDNSVNVG